MSRTGRLQWGADTEIAADPVASVWQLAGILPVSSLDLHELLAAESLAQLMERTLAVCAEGNEFLDELEAGDE